jgi:hypothetical protein
VRPVDLAHAANSKRRHNPVLSQLASDFHRHRDSGFVLGRVFEKASGPDVVGKEQLDLLPQTAVNAAGFRKKRTAGLGRVFQRAVEEFFYATPVQWAHSGPILLQAFSRR